MGLPLTMQNLHAPSISSGPTSTTRNAEGLKTDGLTFAELTAKRDSLEAEIKALISVLDSHNVTMKTPLLTPDGFPRADLDVAQIRTTRARITYLINDLKSLMLVIERHLHAHFASISAERKNLPESVNEDKEPSSSSVPNPDVSRTLTPPFARVDSVAENGPAASAGLHPEDKIVYFGNVNINNHNRLSRLRDCLLENIGKEIRIKVSRTVDGQPNQIEDLVLKPSRDWGGEGLIGCHVLPL